MDRSSSLSLPPVSFVPSHQHVHSLDGARGVSALLVMFSHLGLAHMVPGGLGVTTFFFISGFIITRLLLSEWLQTGSIKIGAFLWRRFCRLWPAIAVSATFIFLVSFLFPERVETGQYLSSITFMQNYYSMIWPQSNPLNIHWSLAVEQHFYLFFPFLLLFMLLGGNPIRIWAFIIGLIAIICVVRLSFYIDAIEHEPFLHYARDASYKWSHLRMDSILWGCLLSIGVYFDETHRFLTRIFQQKFIWIGFAVLLATLLYRDETFRATFRYSIQGFALFLIFSGLLFAEKGGPVRWFLNTGVMVDIGKISFSIYLWHMIILKMVRIVAERDFGLDIAVVTFVLTFCTASLSYHFIEKKFIPYGKKLRWRQNVPVV